MENNTFEMEQLKEQIAILNKKLDHETIVNENLLRNAMSSKMRNANNYAWIDLAMGVVAVLLFFIIYIFGECSGWFFLFTTLMLAVSVIIGFMTNKVKSDDLMNGDLVEVKKKALLMKQQKRKTLLYYSIPVILVWLPWAIYDISYRNHPDFFWGHAISMIIGGIIGGLIGYRMYCKMQKNVTEVLDQIKELEKE